MTFEKTWSFALNTVPTDQSSYLQRRRSWGYQLKSFLVTMAGWTVESSSNSSSSGSSDYWSGLSSLVYASGGSAHSWVVLKSPAGIIAGPDGSYTGNQSRLWFCIDCGFNNFGQAQCIFSFHNVSPTGGSTTTTPTSSNQIKQSLVYGQTTDANNNSHFQFACTSNGNFYAGISGDTYSKFWQFVGILPLGSVSQINSSTLDYPYGCVLFDSQYGYDLTNILRQLVLKPQTTFTGAINAWCEDGTWSPALSGTNPYGNVRFCVLGNSDSSSAIPGGWIGYSFPSGGDSVNSLQQYGQVHVQIESPGKTAYLGRLADIYGSGGGTPQLSVDSISSPTQQYAGNLWLPVNAVMTM